MKPDRPNLAMLPQTGAYRWRTAAGLLVLILVLTLWAFRDTAASLAAIWWRSETYAHGLLVVPVAAWLLWQRRDRVPPCGAARQDQGMGEFSNKVVVVTGAGGGLAGLHRESDRERIEQLRVPPQSVEAEQAVLGGLMVTPRGYANKYDVDQGFETREGEKAGRSLSSGLLGWIEGLRAPRLLSGGPEAGPAPARTNCTHIPCSVPV